MELKTEQTATIGGVPANIFELARTAGLSVCDNAQSTFNRQVLRFAVSVAAPLQDRIEVLGESIRACMAENDRLKLENAELRQVRTKFTAPACPAGMIEHEYCAGTSTWGDTGSTHLTCHLEYTEALPETEIEPSKPARVRLIAAYHRGVNVLDTLVSKGHEICIEEQALAEVQS